MVFGAIAPASARSPPPFAAWPAHVQGRCKNARLCNVPGDHQVPRTWVLRNPVAISYRLAMASRKRKLPATLLGYARVSKSDGKSTRVQVQALKAAGVAKIFREAASGGRWDRPQLQRMLDQLRAGDVVVVWKLDRLSRSLKDLLHILEKIDASGAGFRSLTEAIDTTTAAGRMLMQMLGAFAEFEREMIRERTRAGLDAARSQGRVGGRRPKLSARQQAEVVDMVTSGRKSAADVARLFGVHPSTISRIVSRAYAKA